MGALLWLGDAIMVGVIAWGLSILLSIGGKD
jgi:hypothetical protein